MSKPTYSWYKVPATFDALLEICRLVVAGMDEDPGHSDLDDEQPIHVRMTLGDYRRAKRLLWELEHP